MMRTSGHPELPASPVMSRFLIGEEIVPSEGCYFVLEVMPPYFRHRGGEALCSVAKFGIREEAFHL